MGNREYKSDVFCMLLEDRKNALALYNAINGSNHTNPEMVEICTLEGGISLTIRNDSAFVIDFYLNMFEHQSTVCPNMPMRNLTYVTPMLENMLKDKNLLGSKLIKIPTPRFVVFYNGRRSNQRSMSLSFQRHMRDLQRDLSLSWYVQYIISIRVITKSCLEIAHFLKNICSL